jgi:uncharacterized protein YbaR (Trm112 family)
MSTENSICQNCKQSFEIDDQDFKFYEKVSAPTPLYCPSCRMQRRLVHRNERSLYKRACDLCEKSVVSIYPEKTPFPVYCQKCWWSDGWDPKNFGLEYNSERPFLEQLQELRNKVPRIALLVITSVNSEYTNNTGDLKNCYLIFAAEKNEDCYYGRLMMNCKFVTDAAFVYDSELCYEVVDCRDSYNCMFSERCQSSTDLLFCFNARDSQNCILSTNIRHKRYYIENKQATKEEYEKKRKEILSSYENLEVAKKRFHDLKSQSLVKYAFQAKCYDATGDYLYNCHEARMLFDASNAKACRYLADAEDPIDCYDGNNIYYKPELCYDTMGILQCYKSKHSIYIFYCNEVEYCDSSYNAEQCFGCVGIKKGRYSILNKEYTPEEYARLKKKIIISMKEDGSYGSFIPPQCSLFGYNETLAKDFFPLSKEEVQEKGFKWQEAASGMFGRETIPLGAMPGTIAGVGDNILDEVLVCKECSRNFRITKGELDFYRKMGVPLPHKDFECRHQDRMRSRTPRKLFPRQCVCDYKVYENTTKHQHHPESRCPNEFKTSYSPDRPEIVYCESCYNAEVA